MTKKQAIAQHLGMDTAELNDYLYHSGRTTVPVWAIDNEYYCVNKIGNKPAKHRDGMTFNWVKVTDTYLIMSGYEVYKSTNQS